MLLACWKKSSAGFAKPISEEQQTISPLNPRVSAMRRSNNLLQKFVASPTEYPARPIVRSFESHPHSPDALRANLVRISAAQFPRQRKAREEVLPKSKAGCSLVYVACAITGRSRALLKFSKTFSALSGASLSVSALLPRRNKMPA